MTHVSVRAQAALILLAAAYLPSAENPGILERSADRRTGAAPETMPVKSCIIPAMAVLATCWFAVTAST